MTLARGRGIQRSDHGANPSRVGLKFSEAGLYQIPNASGLAIFSGLSASIRERKDNCGSSVGEMIRNIGRSFYRQL